MDIPQEFLIPLLRQVFLSSGPSQMIKLISCPKRCPLSLLSNYTNLFSVFPIYAAPSQHRYFHTRSSHLLSLVEPIYPSDLSSDITSKEDPSLVLQTN